MANKQITTKIWEETLDKLREIHRLTGESMASILDRLITEEHQRATQQGFISITKRETDAGKTND